MSTRDSGVRKKLSIMILQDILSGKRELGGHLNAKTIAEDYNVSRTPVRDALMELEEHKVVSRAPNKGFFVADNLPDSVHNWVKSKLENETDDYQQLADDWLTDSIPDTLTEQYVRDRYNWTKSKALSILNRATKEGWAERNPGYGWKLLPVAKTTESFSELYRFRAAIEPAALLEPTFRLDRQVTQKLRDVQNRILDSTVGEISDSLILEYGANFHEELIKLSGNPYFLMALQRVNKMRKLMEYKAQINRERLVTNCSEHLEILDMLEQGGTLEASYQLKQHLSKALDRKASKTRSWG
ncbi:GntR family transcriptional regulator [Marinomonas rhizomae]|uniref:GntR family transcriptional regulator n=1 Tax=Marinomonas rhizomae TaxID=491948 RepID=UPI002102B676|nr:GntR family transcriptional regulator [Marinomonas rhizomae]UTV98426.1 GntR family transcriptional regulator [Marinomonas rhizomae]